MAGKANIEVRPKMVNKGEIAKRLIMEMEEGNGGVEGGSPDFVLCLGDDFTDEGTFSIFLTAGGPRKRATSIMIKMDADHYRALDMFRALSLSSLPDEHIFSVTVGASSKQTLASWHLLEPSDVISVIALLNGSVDAGNVGAVSVVEGRVPESRL